jgi:predicted ArsR family transcriptional regulator
MHNIDKFISLFKGRKDCYGLQKFCMKEPLSHELYLAHIEGKQRIGVYPLHNGDGSGPGQWASWIAADIDDGDFNKALKLHERLEVLGISSYIERSKSKGYHVFTFFNKDIEALKLRLVWKMLLDDLGFKCELFPKQDKSDESGYGNFINLPLFGGDVSNEKTIFVDSKGLPLFITPEELSQIVVNDIKLVEQIIEDNNLKETSDVIRDYIQTPSLVGSSKLEMSPCVKRIIDGEVKAGQHNEAWFRLAIYYKEKGTPRVEATKILLEWNKKNKNNNPEKELLRTIQSVYEKGYKAFPCGEGVLADLCDQAKCPILHYGLRNKDIEKGLMVMVHRTEESMIFRKNDYELRLSSFQMSKGGKFKVSLTMMQHSNKKLIFKDNIDLDSAANRKKFVKAANDQEVDSILVDLHELINQQFEKEEKEKLIRPKQFYVMTEKEKEEALTFLRESPNILAKVMDATNRMGVVGEYTVRLMAYLSFTSRIRQPISITVKGESSSGKSFSCQNIMKLIPEEGVHFMTRATAQAFYHMPEDGLKNRICYINELPGSESADYSIRSAQSEGDLILYLPVKDPKTGDMHTINKTVKGPVGFLITTTKPGMFDENETRNFAVFSDDSPELTRAIGQITIRKAMGEDFKITDEEIALWKNAQRLLNPDYRVIIPYAEEVFSCFPDQPVRIRRDRERFKELIEIITVLHQYHREKREQKDGTVQLISTLADYYCAQVIAGSLLTYTIYELSPVAEDIWKSIKEMEEEHEDSPERISLEEFSFRYKDVAEFMGWKADKVKKWIYSLVRAGLIDYAERSTGGKKAAIFKITNQGKRFSPAKLGFLVGVKEIFEKYPCEVSLFYNPITGENFDPLNKHTEEAPEGLLEGVENEAAN